MSGECIGWVVGEGGGVLKGQCFDWSTPVLTVHHFNWSSTGFACQVVRIQGASHSSGPWHANIGSRPIPGPRQRAQSE